MATWGELEKAGTKWRDLEEMTWGELEEFCVINPKTKQIPDDMEVSFVPMQSVSDTGAVQTDEVRKASEVKKGFTFFEEGDVLFAKITPCMENGKGGIARGLKNGVGFGSTEFHVLHPAPEKVSSEWLYYLTSWDEFRKQCARNMTGSAGQKRVPKSYLEHYKVHLPSLEEQRRIAAVLDKVSDLIAKRREQLDKLDELVKARFVEMFGDVASNPNGYPIKNFDEVSILITDGEHATPRRTDKGIYLLSARNVLNHKLQLDDVDYIDEKEYNRISRRIIPQAGDVLISCSGSIGRCCTVPDGLKFQMVRSAALIRFDESTNPVFAEWLITSDDLQQQIAQSATQSSQANLFQGKIRKLRGFIPPIELQNQFVDFVVQTDKSKLTIQQSLDKLEVLKKALMQQYFG